MSGHWRRYVWLAVGFVIVLSCVAWKTAIAQNVQSVQQILVPLNKSVTLTVPTPFTSAVVGSPDIADALAMTDRTLLIQAKKIGTTNVSIFDNNQHLVKVVDVEVTLDTRSLQSRIRSVVGTTGIRVSSDNGQVVL